MYHKNAIYTLIKHWHGEVEQIVLDYIYSVFLCTKYIVNESKLKNIINCFCDYDVIILFTILIKFKF